MFVGIDKIILSKNEWDQRIFKIEDISLFDLHKSKLGKVSLAKYDREEEKESKPNETRKKDQYYFIDGKDQKLREGERYSLNYRPKGSNSNISIDMSQRGIRIILNPSSLFHRYNLFTEPKLLSSTVLDILNKTLNKFGIKGLDVMSMNLYRLDLAKQAFLSEETSLFIEVLRFRTKGKRMYPKDWNGETFVYGNTMREVTLYNKAMELLTKDLTTKEREEVTKLMEKNYTRLEARWKRKIEVQKLGIKTYKELSECSKDFLNESYKDFIYKNILESMDLDQVKFKEYQKSKDLKEFKEELQKQYPRKYLTVLKDINLINQDRMIEIMREYERMEVNKSSRSKWKKYHNEVLILKSKHDDLIGKVSEKDMLDEIKKKFLE